MWLDLGSEYEMGEQCWLQEAECLNGTCPQRWPGQDGWLCLSADPETAAHRHSRPIQISWCYTIFPWNSEQHPPIISMSGEEWMQAGMLYVALHFRESRSPQDLWNETKLWLLHGCKCAWIYLCIRSVIISASQQFSDEETMIIHWRRSGHRCSLLKR